MEPEHGWTVTRQVFNEPDEIRVALPISLESLHSSSGRSRRSSPPCSIRSKANSTASCPRRLLRSAWKSGVPSSLRTSLTVDQERLRLHAERSFNDGREANRPAMSIAREAADPRAIPAHHQAVAVVLDFVNPERARRWARRLGGQARFDEAGV
jgi:hypothetical protein